MWSVAGADLWKGEPEVAEAGEVIRFMVGQATTVVGVGATMGSSQNGAPERTSPTVLRPWIIGGEIGIVRRTMFGGQVMHLAGLRKNGVSMFVNKLIYHHQNKSIASRLYKLFTNTAYL